MKKLLLGAAAALAIAAPGVASAQSGYVDLSYANTDGEVAGFDFDDDGLAVGGAYSWGGDGSFGVQLDGAVGDSDDVTSVNVGGHAFTRSTNFLIGGFAGFGDVDDDSGSDFDYWTVGAEGQWYLSRTTFDAALSYSEADDLDADFTGLDLGVTHFATDNFSFGGGVGVGEVEVAGFDADTISYGVGTEYQFSAVPISLFGGWQHAEIDDFDSDSDTLSVGVRYNFGGTLLERNRSGAGLGRLGGFGRFGGLL